MKKKLKRIIIFSCYGYLALGLLVTVLCLFSTDFADFWNRYPASFFRSVFAYLTYLFPVSVAEYLLLTVPVWLFLLFKYAIKKASRTWRDTLNYVVSIFSIVAFFLGSMTVNFSAGYKTSSLDVKLGLAESTPNVDRLSALGKYLLDEANEYAGKITVSETGSSMSYGIDELNSRLDSAYGSLCEKYSFIPKMHTRVKPIVLSEVMTYTHIAGVYSFFTGEANLNTNFPDYTLPFSAAHEMAHQHGFAREEEANFIAFLCCIESDDDYIRYSGYLSLYEYVASALYSTDKIAYFEMLSDMSNGVRNELIAYNEFFEKYEENAAADITGAVNDVYLKSNGQSAGSMSYGLVVELAVSYYADTLNY